MASRLADLDDQAAILSAEAGGKRGVQGERVSGSHARPSPAPYVDDLDELLQTLLSWEDAYRETRRLPPRPRRGRYAPSLAGTVAWLGAHVDGLLGAFDGAEDFGREVLSLHRRLTAHTTADRPRRRRPLPCPSCDLCSLSHREGDEHVRCGNRACGRVLTLEEYDVRVREATRTGRGPRSGKAVRHDR